ncbi:hypothetical protein HNR23_004941 [Nocardiopsis mwathae]|uniref:DUF742 domain-containing protein n=1 Tax=Nocardiopsis mwathae TaxID=1472723 RepID=A0A7W9YPK4_9ACTN|nr:DUF742 domain-containing protein [Nocardiopsis mwathae]MBB6174881.1 hypothetical protein [Nocardiopsis mwathae]
MNPRPVDREDPDRLYTIIGGRARGDEPAFDTVTLIVSESEPTPAMQSEHARILRMCRRPTAVVEISAQLRLPVSVVKILLRDLLDTGYITARHPPSTTGWAWQPTQETLEQVLIALQRL